MRKQSMFRALSLIWAMLLFCSCEHFDLSSETASKGNLKVSVIQIAQTPFSTQTRATVAEVAKRLSFVIYDTGGSRLKQINQQSSDKDFGTAAFQLGEGDYVLVVIGHSSNGNPTTTDPTSIRFDNKMGFSDTYLFVGRFTIGENPVERGVSLERIVSLCRFVITDDYPENVSKLEFFYTGGSGAFNANTGFGSADSQQKVTFDVSSGQKEFDLYTFPHEQEGRLKLKVTALDANGNTLLEREFEVPIQQNYITWLKGEFFSDSGSTSTTISDITVNTEWAGEYHETF